MALVSAVAWGVLTGCGRGTQPGAGGGPGGFPTQVVVVEATRGSVSETLPLVGTVAANEMVEIKSETDGLVQEILFLEGQRVSAGDMLIRLDDGKLRASLEEAKANLKFSEANLERSKNLFEDQVISQQEFDQIASAYSLHRATLDLREEQLKDTRIYAPFAGVMGRRSVSPGQVISKNTTLTWVVDLDPVKVEFDVPEKFLSQLQPGQTIELTVAAYGEETFFGEVFFVSPYVDANTRTALVKAEVPNPESRLKAGMFASLELTLTVRENAILVPEMAIYQLLQDGWANIFLVGADQTAEIRRVKLGNRLAREVEIREGLEGGEQVVVEGLQKIGPGSKLRLAPPKGAAAVAG